MSGKRGIGINHRKGLLIVGLTGHFGAGKSTVTSFFEKLGARVIDADHLAHEVFQKKSPVYRRIRSLFPELKNCDRKQVAKIVFRDGRKRRALESLVHPYVFKRMREEMDQKRSGIVILEVPLLFESGFHRDCDRTLVVKSSASQILKRLYSKGYSKAATRARWRAQMPLGEKIRRADYVIDNSKDRAKTRQNVLKIWKKLVVDHQKRERSF